MSADELTERIRAFALGLPEAWEDHPWGESVAKVRKKVFVFMGKQPPSTGRCAPSEGLRPGTAFGLSVKLPLSGEDALGLPFTSPTGYGLGRSGWVSARFEPGEEIPVDLLTAWIEESYRAVAPKKLIKQLDGG